MRLKNRFFLLSLVLLLTSCNSKETNPQQKGQLLNGEVEDYVHIDERMEEFILANETSHYDKIYKLTNDEGRQLLKEQKMLFEPENEIANKNPLVAKYLIQSRMADNAYEIERFTLFEGEGILLYLFNAKNKGSGLTFATPYVAKLIEGEWELMYYANRFHLDSYQTYAKTKEVNGNNLSKLVLDYPTYTKVIVSKKESQAEYLKADPHIKEIAEQLLLKEE